MPKKPSKKPHKKRIFYGIVTEFDDSEEGKTGPVFHKFYASKIFQDLKEVEAIAEGITDLGWVRIAKVTVEIPGWT